VVLIGNLVVYPMTILSGATVPLEVMPETVRTISRFVPLTHLVALLRGLWFGEGWGNLLTEVAVLAGVGIVGTLIVAWTFRWE
jgi:ABC-2 type transport system permease protein